jgi:hypothetical protein
MFGACVYENMADVFDIVHILSVDFSARTTDALSDRPLRLVVELTIAVMILSWTFGLGNKKVQLVEVVVSGATIRDCVLGNC